MCMYIDVDVCFVGDAFGYVLAWCSLLPVFICIVFATLIIFRRDLFTASILHSCVFANVISESIEDFSPILLLDFILVVIWTHRWRASACKISPPYVAPF